MTPEMARELIDGIDFYYQHQMWAEFPKRYEPYAVYELAELVAGLRYEYAVQVPHPLGGWSYIIIDSETDEHSMTPHAHWADWEDNLNDANCLAESLERARVVRRLVGEPEVAE